MCTKLSRSKTEIIQAILKTVRNDPCGKTKIIRYANLDWDMAEEYIGALVKDDMLKKEKIEEGKQKNLYKLTEKGRNLSKEIGKIRNLSRILQ